jgi:hypothetical protein
MKRVYLLPALLPFVFVNCATPKIDDIKTDAKPEITNQTTAVETPKIESPEEKAVRLAEEFIRRNGYTTAPADKNNLSYETVEYSDSVDDLLKQRYNTLEAKAYGVFYRGRLGDEKGWTVIFRYTAKVVKELEKLPNSKLVSNPKLTGRAVTMNGNFQNLLVEHKDFFLDKVDKKL